MSSNELERAAAAPISWGVCEVPGWGHQMSRDRVLSEMAGTGLTATEVGPPGFLPSDSAEARELLDRYGMTAIAGFVPVVLHRADTDPSDDLRRAIGDLKAAGATTVVLAAATGQDGYDARPELGDEGWRILIERAEGLVAQAAEAGMEAVLHPHVGTMVETRPEVERVIEHSTVPLCLDSGHLLIGGSDPVAVAQVAPDRVAHVHLKDVDAATAAAVRRGEVSYTSAVSAGLYRPLGAGDVDVSALVSALEAADYRGWYVLEQDTVLGHEPEPGTGPLDDVRESLAFLTKVLAA